MTERKKSRQQLAVIRLTSKKFQTVFVIVGGRMRFSPRMPAMHTRGRHHEKKRNVLDFWIVFTNKVLLQKSICMDGKNSKYLDHQMHTLHLNASRVLQAIKLGEFWLTRKGNSHRQQD